MGRRKTPQTRTVTTVTNDDGDVVCHVDGSSEQIAQSIAAAVITRIDQAVGKTDTKIERVNAKVDRHYQSVQSKLGTLKANAKTDRERLTMVERKLAAHERNGCFTVDHVVRTN